eukprot:8275394-Pyramimonas_sp.AAC.1
MLQGRQRNLNDLSSSRLCHELTDWTFDVNSGANLPEGRDTAQGRCLPKRSQGADGSTRQGHKKEAIVSPLQDITGMATEGVADNVAFADHAEQLTTGFYQTQMLQMV